MLGLKGEPSLSNATTKRIDYLLSHHLSNWHIKPLTVTNVYETKLHQILFLQLPMTRLGEMVNLQNCNSSKKINLSKMSTSGLYYKTFRIVIYDRILGSVI